MVGLTIGAMCRKWMVFAAMVLALGLTAAVQPAAAQHKANDNDMELPTNDLDIVKAGRAKYAQRCSFCHGGDGHGGKGPCLSCGVFKFTGNTNSEIYATIAAGVPKNLGGTMGAFGTTMSMEEILSVITFLRWEEKRRVAEGEIPDPSKNKDNELPVFPTTN
jgi:mono/diheme cytochrome c family protein